MSDTNDTQALLAELRALREEVCALRVLAESSVVNAGVARRVLERFADEGVPITPTE